MIEQHYSKAMLSGRHRAGKDTMFLVRVPHSSGMLEGHYTVDTVFPENDHRRHRPKSWLINGVQEVAQLRFLETADHLSVKTSLQWLLNDPRNASTLPNIYEEGHLIESLQKAPDTQPLTADELAQIDELCARNFGIQEGFKFKGTMELETAAV